MGRRRQGACADVAPLGAEESTAEAAAAILLEEEEEERQLLPKKKMERKERKTLDNSSRQQAENSTSSSSSSSDAEENDEPEKDPAVARSSERIARAKNANESPTRERTTNRRSTPSSKVPSRKPARVRRPPVPGDDLDLLRSRANIDEDVLRRFRQEKITYEGIDMLLPEDFIELGLTPRDQHRLLKFKRRLDGSRRVPTYFSYSS